MSESSSDKPEQSARKIVFYDIRHTDLKIESIPGWNQLSDAQMEEARGSWQLLQADLDTAYGEFFQRYRRRQKRTGEAGKELAAEPLFAATEYAKWYTGKFGDSRPDWYVFPFGKPSPKDPTRPQTSLKTAWSNVRAGAKVEGRFHDNRHTFVTDLSESGAGDQVIQDMAGHVSRDMVKHYSHIRTEAKRRAVEGLTSRIVDVKPETSQFSETVPQEVPQVGVIQ